MVVLQTFGIEIFKHTQLRSPASYSLSKIPSKSLIILDDFFFKEANNRQSKLDFLKIKNYTLRHREITLILVIHNLFGTNLANDILLANHLFLAYSNLGEFIFR